MAASASDLIIEKIGNFSVPDDTVVLNAEMIVRESTL